ncbi:metal-dependent hydrolase [Psychroflexus halocasei]|uniref:Inner membrane protein n=1 Tax=Psychroflexus halocasei TaxID=908615 RepID=A0A1H3ZTR9_9FLAO|nr:metal-dependent hydrolase [Psychroflexus halocasei]SEA27113.1 inner membrane protein [Psychroflexus halocasei]
MDSLTQIVLGAAVGQAVAGRQIGNRAMLYGAIAGTIPDLDVIASNFTDTVSALEIHRGFTHSILFSVLFAPVFGWLFSLFEKQASWKKLSWLFFWGFVTHPLLDAHTTWGTQLFWPLDLRLAYKNIFVIDPLYTLPFLIFLIMAMRQKRSSPKRRKYNKIGLIISSSYLALTLVLKGITYFKFQDALKNQDIDYVDMQTKPSAFNSVLWTANVKTNDAYLIGHYSFFDSKPISFKSYPKNHELINEIKDKPKMQRMIKISENWFTISKENEKLYFNDLRFGLMSLSPNAKTFVFSYEISEKNDTIFFKERDKKPEDGKKLVKELWGRLKGN